MQITSSKCMVNLFLSLDFMKVSVEKQHSFAIEPIIYSKFSQLDVLHDFYFKNPKEVRVLHNLVTGLTSKGFYIANLTFFVMVKTNKDL